jgi:hypothetical protein
VIAQGDAQDVLKVTDPEVPDPISMDVTPGAGALRLTSYVSTQQTFCGPAYPVRAEYAFTARGTTLELQPKGADGCPDRDSLLTGTWRRR